MEIAVNSISSDMELSIICVNWNSIDYLESCIASVIKYTSEISFEIIVVDNASPANDDVDRLKSSFPNVLTIRCRENVGFAKANNLGYRQSAGEYILFLNPDTRLQGPAINTMLSAAKTLRGAAIIGCRLLNADLSIQTSCVQKVPTIINQLLDAEVLHRSWPGCPLWDISPLYGDDTDVAKVEVISGACMLVKRSVFEQIGLFSEDYFMYADDIDLCWKAIQGGLANYYVGKATIIHYGGGSSQQQEINNWATIMKFRSVEKFCAKRRGRWYAHLFRVAMGIAAVARLLLITALLGCRGNSAKGAITRAALCKWTAILKWSLGLDHLVNPMTSEI